MPYLQDSEGLYGRIAMQPNAVRTAELLAIITGMSATESHKCLKEIACLGESAGCDAFEALRLMTEVELGQVMSRKQAARLLAAIELGRRTFVSRPAAKVVDCPKAVADIFSYDLQFREREYFAVLILNIKLHMVSLEIISEGSQTTTLADPKQIFGAVLRHRGVCCAIGHNHPATSGGFALSPSPEDISLTKQLLQAAQTLCLPVVDHIIVGNEIGKFYSLREETSLWDDYPQWSHCLSIPYAV